MVLVLLGVVSSLAAGLILFFATSLKTPLWSRLALIGVALLILVGLLVGVWCMNEPPFTAAVVATLAVTWPLFVITGNWRRRRVLQSLRRTSM